MLFLYTISFVSIVFGSSFGYGSALTDLHELQKPYLSKTKAFMTFKQRSFFADFAEPMEAAGRALINRKDQSFLWRIEKPSVFEFSVNKKEAQMRTGDNPAQKFLMKDLPDKFKFIQVFFEVLGFEKISSKSWKVKKEGTRKFSLKSTKAKMPIKNLKIELKKSGAPHRADFINTSGTRFEILFQEVSSK